MLSAPIKLPIWAHGAAVLAVIAGFQGVKRVLDASYAASNHPVDYATGQLAFSAERIMGYYAHMQSLGTLPVYWRTQVIDFGFLAMMGLLALMLGTFIARLSPTGSWGHRAGIGAAVLGIVGAGMDACENLMSFVLLANPAEIAPAPALIYSAFAAAKFALLTGAMALVPIGLILAAAHALRRKAG